MFQQNKEQIISGNLGGGGGGENKRLTLSNRCPPTPSNNKFDAFGSPSIYIFGWRRLKIIGSHLAASPTLNKLKYKINNWNKYDLKTQIIEYNKNKIYIIVYYQI